MSHKWRAQWLLWSGSGDQATPMIAFPQHQRVALVLENFAGTLNVGADAQWTLTCLGATSTVPPSGQGGICDSPESFHGFSCTGSGIPPLLPTPHLLSNRRDMWFPSVLPSLLPPCLISARPANSSLFKAQLSGSRWVTPPQLPLVDSTALGTHLKNSPTLYSMFIYLFPKPGPRAAGGGRSVCLSPSFLPHS